MVYECGGGRHFSQGGGLAKKHKLGQTSVFGAFPPKKGIVKKDRRSELRAPRKEGPLATPPFGMNTAAISSPYPGADVVCRGYNNKKS